MVRIFDCLSITNDQDIDKLVSIKGLVIRATPIIPDINLDS